jgi:hypothetical protein
MTGDFGDGKFFFMGPNKTNDIVIDTEKCWLLHGWHFYATAYMEKTGDQYKISPKEELSHKFWIS